MQFNNTGPLNLPLGYIGYLNILGCESPLLPPHIQLLKMSLVTQ